MWLAAMMACLPRAGGFAIFGEAGCGAGLMRICPVTFAVRVEQAFL